MPRTKPAPRSARRTPAPASPSLSPQPAPLSPSSDLATLAGQIPAEILQQLAAAVRSGHWLFAVWRVADGRIDMDRTMVDFPNADLDKAVELLSENLKKAVQP